MRLQFKLFVLSIFASLICNQQSFSSPANTATASKESVTISKNETDINLIDKQLNDCLEKHFSAAEVLDCCEMAYKAWDKELNDVYRQLMKELPARTKTLLKFSQLEWIKYRDRDFELNDEVYEHASGSMYRPLRVQHRIDVVKARALLLKELLDVPNDS